MAKQRKRIYVAFDTNFPNCTKGDINAESLTTTDKSHVYVSTFGRGFWFSPKRLLISKALAAISK